MEEEIDRKRSGGVIGGDEWSEVERREEEKRS